MNLKRETFKPIEEVLDRTHRLFEDMEGLGTTIEQLELQTPPVSTIEALNEAVSRVFPGGFQPKIEAEKTPHYQVSTIAAKKPKEGPSLGLIFFSGIQRTAANTAPIAAKLYREA